MATDRPSSDDLPVVQPLHPLQYRPPEQREGPSARQILISVLAFFWLMANLVLALLLMVFAVMEMMFPWNGWVEHTAFTAGTLVAGIAVLILSSLALRAVVRKYVGSAD